jgi:hypothetical protein
MIKNKPFFAVFLRFKINFFAVRKVLILYFYLKFFEALKASLDNLILMIKFGLAQILYG